MSQPTNETPFAYPITVDEKTLWALIHCGDAIIRSPKTDRLKKWEELRALIARQCKANAFASLKGAKG